MQSCIEEEEEEARSPGEARVNRMSIRKRNHGYILSHLMWFPDGLS